MSPGKPIQLLTVDDHPAEAAPVSHPAEPIRLLVIDDHPAEASA